jgi:hypothetical protein
MRPTTLTLTNVSTSAPVPLNQYVTPFNVALGATVVSGTPTYTVQYTFDDVFAPGYTPASGNWTNHPSLTTQTTTKDSNIAYPVTAVRFSITSGTGVVSLAIIEAGSIA